MKEHKVIQQGCFLFHYSLANSRQMSQNLLRKLVFDNYRTCPLHLNHSLNLSPLPMVAIRLTTQSDEHVFLNSQCNVFEFAVATVCCVPVSRMSSEVPGTRQAAHASSQSDMEPTSYGGHTRRRRLLLHRECVSFKKGITFLVSYLFAIFFSFFFFEWWGVLVKDTVGTLTHTLLNRNTRTQVRCSCPSGHDIQLQQSNITYLFTFVFQCIVEINVTISNHKLAKAFTISAVFFL